MKMLILGAIIGPLFISSGTFANSTLIEQGRRVYVANCLRCHNIDPNENGSVGPQIADAPYEVMYSKIMTGKYPDPLPAGFVPKRTSRAMKPMQGLKDDISAIFEYVKSVKK